MARQYMTEKINILDIYQIQQFIILTIVSINVMNSPN